MRVVHLQRRSFPGQFSIERVFAEVRRHLPPRFQVEVVITSGRNQGVLSRVATVMEARRLKADVVHVTGDINYAALLIDRRHSVVTIHDTEFLDRSSAAKRLVYEWLWLRLPIWRAGVVTVGSEGTKQDLLKFAPRAGQKIRVIPHPIGAGFVPVPREQAARPTILLVGTWPAKNVVRSAAALAGIDCRVRVLGALDPDQELALKEAGLDFEALTGLDDEAVRAAYADCDLLLFPSLKEGFGLPVIEAQATGRPVVTSNSAPLPEVAGGAACFVDPYDVESIRSGVRAVLADGTYRADLVRRGLDNVQRFQPEVVAAAYARVYDEFASRA
jgi:glycosyltransferase involved in cell wall biosynthesis